MFMNPETDPADVPAISEVTDQNELCDRYSAPAPPARIRLAKRVSRAYVLVAIKIVHSAMLAAATQQRPTRLFTRSVTKSLIHPPSGEQTAIARNGSME